MKKTLLFVCLCFIGLGGYAQELPNLKNIKLNKRSQYKGTEHIVLKVVTYLFQTPIDKKNNDRLAAGQFLIRWMNGTPDYTFHLEENETDFFNTDTDLMLMYMAGLTKYTLEHRDIKDQRNLILGTMHLVLPYLYNQESKKNWSAKLWQLNDAALKGKLQSFLYPN